MSLQDLERRCRLADFARFSYAINTRIAIVDQEGTVREGIVTEATAEEVKVRFDSGVKSFSRGAWRVQVLARRPHRRRDQRGVLGFVVGALASQGCESAERCHTWALGLVTGGVGYLLDAAETHRQPLYRAQAQRAAAKPKPALSLSFRF